MLKVTDRLMSVCLASPALAIKTVGEMAWVWDHRVQDNLVSFWSLLGLNCANAHVVIGGGDHGGLEASLKGWILVLTGPHASCWCMSSPASS